MRGCLQQGVLQWLLLLMVVLLLQRPQSHPSVADRVGSRWELSCCPCFKVTGPRVSHVAVRMPKHTVAADPLAVIVSCSLLALVVCNAALASWGAAPAKVADVLPAPAFLPGDSLRIVMVVDAAARPGSGARPRIGSRTPEVLRVNWGDAARGRSAPAENSLASLIRAYGYSQPPLLLTFDNEGHVLRVRTPQTSPAEGADDR